MNIQELHKNNIVFNWETGDAKVVDLAILNVKPGEECMKMCGLFNIKPNSLMIPGGGESSIIENQDYINFIADASGSSSFYIGELYEPNSGWTIIYYPDIEPILEELYEEFPQFLEQTPGNKSKPKIESSKTLYELLGMEAVND